MARTVYDLQINKPDDFIQFISNDYFAKEGFKLVNYKGEQVWKKGVGFLVAPSFIKFSYGGGMIHLEAWIKNFGEQPLDNSFVASIPKSQHKNRVNTLLSLLNQPLPGVSPAGMPPAGMPMQGAGPAEYPGAAAPDAARQPVSPDLSGQAGPAQPQTFQQPVQPYGQQPVPVAVHNPTKQSVLSLTTGLVSLLGILIPIVGVICGATAIVSGRTGRTSTKKGMATAGLVLGIIGLVVSILMWVANFILSMAV